MERGQRASDNDTSVLDYLHVLNVSFFCDVVSTLRRYSRELLMPCRFGPRLTVASNILESEHTYSTAPSALPCQT